MFETPLANHSYREVRQSDAFAWAGKTFGPVAADKRERARRFIEEAIELAQACGLHPREVDKILLHVYSKPPGQVAQEVGGVGVTLLCLCEAFGVSADVEERRELLRVYSMPAQDFRDRHNAKAAAGVAAPIT